MKRLAWLILPILSCAPKAHPVGEGFGTVTHYNTFALRYLTFTDSVRRDLVDLYWRAQADSLESIACLYGEKKKDDVTVTRWQPAQFVLRMAHAVLFEPGTSGCPDAQGIVGTFHTHLAHAGLGVNRNPSTPDRMSFYRDPRMIVMMIGVGVDPEDSTRLLVYWTLRHGNQGYLAWP